ncbi:hypothetical protein NUU61_005150 [Penicillium alfredii]|uniref:Uncharacterized protein n=1 Tax=Penicillium alfredii TaxID=1506179 RepID=A0A9W9F976_9EURO|nr:uncharacterized protein NUU61_005150 [Penicillium alfredii]KAJ5095794.1 hypothetical protein NUU61_005150 [Penicillium alfredii]
MSVSRSTRHIPLPQDQQIPEYYQSMPGQWSELDTSAYPSTFVGVNHPYCTEPMVPSSVLTPTSLPDSSYQSSPALGQHSPQCSSLEYQYGVNEPLPQPQGLGINVSFPTEFPQSTAPAPGYMYAATEEMGYGMHHITPSMSPHAPALKRMRYTPPTPSSRDAPVNIMPHPQGVQQIELERQRSHASPQPHQRPRARGRGRRDPQAEEEDAFVERLREQNLSWRTVREMFRRQFNKDASEARLQMRLLRRRKDRLARWEENDVQLLVCAHETWETEKFSFLAEKMIELGASKMYTPEQCKAQLRLLETKQQWRDRGGTSPSAISDPPLSPPNSQK